ncbi:unnamed protein product [Blepharisma stoltei]|uniref:Uncharacterized protein n=1 Tax=Blepharisma stoltei TaxID=1481888 RepID=A0AAU9K6H9_9CILI|nr:unnamed protein product [Blepharisma stoltei]
MLIFFLTIFQAWGRSFSSIGTITPADILPINPSKNNANEYADYTFTFQLSRQALIGDFIIIDFPRQYSSSLTTAVTCSMPCTISNLQVTLTSNKLIYTQSFTSVAVYSVLNPSTSGGTGPFQISAYSSQYLTQRNSVFGVIGISPSPGALTSAQVAIDTNGNSKVNSSTNYLFSFKTQTSLQKGNWMKFTFPNGFLISNTPSCTNLKIDGKLAQANNYCVVSGNEVTLNELPVDISASSYISISISATTPGYVQTTGSFSIQTGTTKTNSIIDKAVNIPGISITAGDITNISLTPNNSFIASRGKTQLYTLKFTPAHSIPLGGSITLGFSSNFNCDGSSILYMNYGLIDISQFQTVTMSYSTSTKILIITNFQAFKPQEISLTVQLTNLPNSGATKAIAISTLNENGNTIDQNLSDAKTIISSYTSLSVSLNMANTPNSVQTATFTIIPNILIPNQGYVWFTFPSDFTIGNPTNSNCQITPKNVATDNSLSCTSAGTTIKVKLFSSTSTYPAGSGDFLSYHDSKIAISSVLTTPQYEGYYYIDVQSYDQNSLLLETGSVIVHITYPAFTSSGFLPVHTVKDTPTLLSFTISPSVNIPSAVIPNDLTNSYSYIEISVPTKDSTNLLFRTDLGLGAGQESLIECKSPQKQINCYLAQVPASTGASNNVVIRITGYSQISSGSTVEFMFPNIKYSQSAVSSIGFIAAYLRSSYKTTTLNRDTVNYLAGSDPTQSSTDSATISLSNLNLFADSELTITSFTISTDTTSGLNSAILVRISPVHGEGYCTDSISCKVDNNSKTCFCFSASNMIYIQNSALSAATHTLRISGLKNPGSVPAGRNGIIIYACQNSLAENIVTESTYIPALTEGTLLKATLEADDLHKGSAGVTYTIKLQTLNKLPENSKILINFSNMYTLTSLSPGLICSYIGLQQASNAGISCVASTTTITISNFLSLPEKSYINIMIFGFINPSSSGTFSVKVQTNEGYTIDSFNSIPELNFDTQYTAGELFCADLSPFPSNRYLYADYMFSCAVTNYIHIGGSIHIYFPSQYAAFPSPLSCILDSGILKSCTMNGAEIVAVTASKIEENFILRVRQIQNPGQGTFSSFYAHTEFNGVTLDTTLPSTFSAKILEDPKSLSISDIVFYPRNEGEIATYEFSILPSASFTTDYSISIIFPNSYDNWLGNTIKCSGSYDMSWNSSNDHEILITLASDYTYCKSCKIDISLYGIINPSYTSAKTDYFKVGIISENAWIQYNDKAGPALIYESPSIMILNYLVNLNLYTRYSNSFSLDITFNDMVPSKDNGGEIFVDFPSQYSLDNANPECTTSNFWQNGAPDIEKYYNTIKIEGNSAAYAGNLEIKIKNISNPLYEGKVGSLVVRTYDGVNQAVMGRTYQNVNYYDFDYVYPGPLIKINSDEIVSVEAGSTSKDIFITLDYPCALGLILIPNCEGFIFTPNQISLSVGQVKASFTISVPYITISDTYIVQWAISGELSSPFYTPIFESYLRVVHLRNLGSRINGILSVPVGGTSLPLSFILDAAPAEDVSVSLGISYTSSGLTVSPSILKFTSSSYIQKFNISASSDITLSGIPLLTISLSGTNRFIYRNIPVNISFGIISSDSISPAINSLTLDKSGKSSASFSVSSNKAAIAYYSLSLFGAPKPSFLDTKNQVLSSNVTKIVFGSLILYGGINNGIDFDGLLAETSYVLYVWLEDMAGRTSSDAASCEFGTDSRYSAAMAELHFNQTYLTKSQVEKIESALMTVLSLPESRLISTSSVSRRLSQSNGTLFYYIVDDLSSTNYPTPQTIITRLFQPAFSSLIPYYDQSSKAKIQAVYFQPCIYELSPKVYTTGKYSEITISVALKEDGYIYATAVANKNNASVLIPQQVVLGVDSENKIVPSISAKMSARVATNVTVSGLNGSTDYNVYVICGNNYPGNPQFSENEVALTIKTLAVPALTPLSLDSAKQLVILAICFLIEII